MTATTALTAAPTIDELRSGPPTVSVERAGEHLGISRTYAYQLAKAGHIPTIKLGVRRMRVPAAALLRLLTEGVEINETNQRV